MEFVDAREEKPIQLCGYSVVNRRWVSAVTIFVAAFSEAEEQQPFFVG
jgi:hypothetical protein